LAARNLERNSVGYEINPDFVAIIRGKLGVGETLPFADGKVEFLTQRKTSIDSRRRVDQLPYVFKDPVQFDKKVDPRKLQFGSRINNKDSKREEYYSVREVISPERLVIGDGLTVRLLGVKSKRATSGKAVEFLRDATRGQRVFLRFDTPKHDADNNLLCYLYLQNRTFLNAHLVKRGLADVDTTLDYKHKSKFLAYRRETGDG